LECEPVYQLVCVKNPQAEMSLCKSPSLRTNAVTMRRTCQQLKWKRT